MSKSTLRIEYCDEWITVDPAKAFVVGREADLAVDDNAYLHRRFLELHHRDNLWWLSNVGSALAATVADQDSRVHAWLAPGAHLPLVFPVSVLRFTAGPTSYELALHLDDAPFTPSTTGGGEGVGATTLGVVSLTDEQRLLVLSLAEPALQRPGTGATTLPSNSDAASRLGWAVTKFNRKLDNVCSKLTRAGVQGMHGSADRLASMRRARLVEYALAARLVTPSDLILLDALDMSGVAD
jgi:hypothetical protein